MEVSTRVFAWRLERRDGVTLGFIAHDRHLRREGLSYRARPGLRPSTVRLALGLDDDGIELSGSLSDEAISERDLTAGRWDGATLRLLRIDWADAAAPPETIFVGELAGVSHGPAGFTAEVNGPAALLDGPIAPVTSAACRAEFGDPACGLSLHRFTHRAAVVAIDGARLTLAAAPPVPVEGFANGRLRWLSGAPAGIVADVVASQDTALTLSEPPTLRPELPARVLLTEGCDKTLPTCRDRFANVLNMRAEPYLPGNDLLTRYPRQG